MRAALHPVSDAIFECSRPHTLPSEIQIVLQRLAGDLGGNKVSGNLQVLRHVLKV